MSIGEYGGEYENHSTGILRICARNLSFAKASEECHVAQPAVSQQIRALEKELGFALLNRTTKGVTLTEAGRAYQGEITAILQNLDRSTRKARAISLGSAGSLIVGIANSGQTAVLGAIEQFSARYPEIHIELKRAHSLNQYQQLSQESFDVAITASPCLAGHNDIRMVGKRNSTLRIAVSKEHPLAKTTKQLTTDDLIGWPHIIADCENEQLFQATYPYLRDGASTPIVRVEDQGIGLATMLLGLGVEAVPEEVFPSLQDGYVVRHVIARCRVHVWRTSNPHPHGRRKSHRRASRTGQKSHRRQSESSPVLHRWLHGQ